jgi:UDP-3-O-[3-hydroxymyristoyl] glucosamine N-acyltransferase
VTNDVPPGIQVLGSPAAPLAETRRQVVIMSKLPEMRKTIRDLVRQVQQLQARLDEMEAGEKKKD